MELTQVKKKTYRAIRHDITRAKQKQNADEVHHPDEKINQIRNVLSGYDLSILELFSGNGNCTKVYSEYGEVLAFEKNVAVYESLLKMLGTVHWCSVIKLIVFWNFIG